MAFHLHNSCISHNSQHSELLMSLRPLWRQLAGNWMARHNTSSKAAWQEKDLALTMPKHVRQCFKFIPFSIWELSPSSRPAELRWPAHCHTIRFKLTAGEQRTRKQTQDTVASNELATWLGWAFISLTKWLQVQGFWGDQAWCIL